MTSKKFHALLAFILLASLAIRLCQLDADAPTDVSTDYSLSVDWSWYTAAAVDRVIGRANDVTSAYDRPLFSVYARALYTLLGPDLVTTNFLSVPPGIIAIFLTALLGRLLYGSEAGLLAAMLLAFNYSFLVFNRAALIYTTVTMLAVLALFLAVKGSRERRPSLVIGAWLLCLASVALLKEISLVLIPALCVGWPARELISTKKTAHRCVVAAALVFLLGTAFALDLHTSLAQKIEAYVFLDESSGILGRALDLEGRSGLFRAAPWMTSLALLAALCRRLEREKKMLAVHVVLGLLLFAPLSYSPLRYLIIFFPALAVMAAAPLRACFTPTGCRLQGASGEAPRNGSADGDPHGERHALRGDPWLRAVKVLLLAYFGYQFCVRLAPQSIGLRCALWCIIVVVPAIVLLTRVSASRLIGRLRRPAVGIAVLLFALVPQLYRTAEAYAAPGYSHKYSLREVDCIVSRDAVLSGLHAHLLTLENTLDRKLIQQVRYGKGRLREIYRTRGITHLTLPIEEKTHDILMLFEVDGAGLLPVHLFHIRRTRIGLYRFPWAEEICALSAYERGVEELREKNYEEATKHFRASIAENPRCGAPHAALAEVLLARNEVQEAAFHVENAVSLNPSDARALAMEAQLLLISGRVREARVVLERVVDLDPENRDAQEILARTRLSSPFEALPR